MPLRLRLALGRAMSRKGTLIGWWVTVTTWTVVAISFSFRAAAHEIGALGMTAHAAAFFVGLPWLVKEIKGGPITWLGHLSNKDFPHSTGMRVGIVIASLGGLAAALWVLFFVPAGSSDRTLKFAVGLGLATAAAALMTLLQMARATRFRQPWPVPLIAVSLVIAGFVLEGLVILGGVG